MSRSNRRRRVVPRSAKVVRLIRTGLVCQLRIDVNKSEPYSVAEIGGNFC